MSPVFPKLPSRPVAAEILSFVGFKHEVKEVLWKLSRNSRKYWRRDQYTLEMFLRSWRLQLDGKWLWQHDGRTLSGELMLHKNGNLTYTKHRDAD